MESEARKNFFYDDFSDRLMITCKKPEDNILGSFRILNVTLDITSDNRIVTAEIRGVSEYLSELNINPSILNNLKDAQLLVRKYNNGYMIYFILQTIQGVVEKIPFNIPTEKVIA